MTRRNRRGERGARAENVEERRGESSPCNTGDRDLHRVLVIIREVQAQMHRASQGLRGKCTLSVESAFASIHNSTRIYYRSEEDEMPLLSLLSHLLARSSFSLSLSFDISPQDS